MFSNNFIVCITQNGKVLGEAKNGTVLLPFDSEYEIRLRNKNRRRAVAKVFIDDENISRGGIIVDAASSVDLECSPDTHKKFKFVNVHSSEAASAGKRPRDEANGVIRVEWQLEKSLEFLQPIIYPPNPWPINPWKPHLPWDTHSRLTTCGSNPQFTYSSIESFSREGCTVEGNQSDQTFTSKYINLEPTKTVMQLLMRGYGKEPISKTCYCEHCGSQVKTKNAKFCWNCGKVVYTH